MIYGAFKCLYFYNFWSVQHASRLNLFVTCRYCFDDSNITAAVCTLFTEGLNNSLVACCCQSFLILQLPFSMQWDSDMMHFLAQYQYHAASFMFECLYCILDISNLKITILKMCFIFFKNLLKFLVKSPAVPPVNVWFLAGAPVVYIVYMYSLSFRNKF